MELRILLVLTFCYFHVHLLQGQELDCDDPDVFDAVDIALKKFNAERKYDDLFALNMVLEAKKLDVPGKNFLVKYLLRETSCANSEDVSWQNCKFIVVSDANSGECTAEIHVKDPLELSTVSQECNITAGPGRVVASRAPLLGGWQIISPRSVELKPLVHHGLQRFNNESDQKSIFKVAEVIKAESQVVAGWNYKVEFSIEETNCSKTEFPDIAPECTSIPRGRGGRCTTTAYVNLKGILALTEQKCTLKAPTRFCAGCPVPFPVDDPHLQELLKVALEKYNNESKEDFHYNIANVTGATSQVVSGVTYRVQFSIAVTNCNKKDIPKLNGDCPPLEDSKRLYCKATIHEAAWLGEINPEVNCGETAEAASEKLSLAQAIRSIPGFTPFRAASVEAVPGTTQLHRRHAHGSRNHYKPTHHKGHKHGHKKHKRKSSEESDEDLVQQKDEDTLNPVPETSEPPTDNSLLQGESTTDNPSQDFSESPHAFFDPLPDLPDLPDPQGLPVPKCPGQPWKPIPVVTTPEEEPRDFDLSDLLPFPEEATAEPQETFTTS